MCCNRDYGCLLAVVISIFLGIILGVLFYFGFIPTILTGLWIAFGIAVLSLIGLITIAVLENRNGENCLCQYASCFLIGIIGTIITAIIAFAIELAVGAIISALVVALISFFFSLLIIVIVLFIRCLIDNNWGCRG